MATATLTVQPYSDFPNFETSGSSLADFNIGILVGDTSFDACLLADDDGKYVTSDAGGNLNLSFFFEDDGAIPLSATINSVKVEARFRTIDLSTEFIIHAASGTFGPAYQLNAQPITPDFTIFDLVDAAVDPFSNNVMTTYNSDVVTVNPSTVAAWTRDDLFAGACTAPDGTTRGGGWTLNFSHSIGDFEGFQLDSVFLVVDYTPAGGAEWWHLTTIEQPALPPGQKLKGPCDDLITLDLPITEATLCGVDVVYTFPDHTILIDGVQYELNELPEDWFLPGFIFQQFGEEEVNWYYFGLQPTAAWTQDDPDPQGWWWSIEGFLGGNQVTVDSRPANPRSFVKIAGFAAGNAGVFGGAPGPSCVFNNHIIYAANDYTLNVTAPTIRTFDGQSDRELIAIPNTTSGAVPKGILSMLAANGVIYLTTYDSGTSTADYAGRVWELDPISATLRSLGDAVFITGHLPYALAWHMGRLWCGTNRGDATAGRVYFFRPDIDTTWTLDYTLSSSSVGGVASMLSFQGKLMVGSDAADAVYAKVITRSNDSTYTDADTGFGGTAKVNNAFLAMAVFGVNLYVSYFNNDTPRISRIRKFTGSAWSTVYTGEDQTNVPFIALFKEGLSLYGIGGSLQLPGALAETPDGTVWSDLSVFLPGPATALPIFGVVS